MNLAQWIERTPVSVATRPMPLVAALTTQS